MKGSGWSLKSIYISQLSINNVNPLISSTCIKLSYHLENQKAIIIKNTDEKCFKYSILSEFDNRLNKCKFSKYNFKILEEVV
jgi:hypothetical protein